MGSRSTSRQASPCSGSLPDGRQTRASHAWPPRPSPDLEGRPRCRARRSRSVGDVYPDGRGRDRYSAWHVYGSLEQREYQNRNKCLDQRSNLRQRQQLLCDCKRIRHEGLCDRIRWRRVDPHRGGVWMMLGGNCSPCCQSPCSTNWSEAVAVEVDMSMDSTFRETAAVSYAVTEGFQNVLSYDYATQQICPDKYTGTFSLTKVGLSIAATSPRTLRKSHWIYDFGNSSIFNLYLTDDFDHQQSYWPHLEWGIGTASILSWKRFSSPQTQQHPSQSELCGDEAITSLYSTPTVGIGGSAKWSRLRYPMFFASSVSPNQYVELDFVRTYCVNNVNTTERQSLAFGGMSQTVDASASYGVFVEPLMTRLQSSGDASDVFGLMGSTVSLLSYSGPGTLNRIQIAGTTLVNAGTFSVSDIRVFF